MTLLLFPLISCGNLSANDVKLPEASPSLTLPCRPPTSLPDRDLRQSEVAIAWGRDRRSLRECAGKHQGLVEYSEDVREVFE